MPYQFKRLWKTFWGTKRVTRNNKKIEYEKENVQQKEKIKAKIKLFKKQKTKIKKDIFSNKKSQ